MKDVPQTNETSEKEVAETPGKRINTYDDMRTGDNSERVETYDDVQKSGSEKRINTYDDLRTEGEESDKAGLTKAYDSHKTDGNEIIEKRRIEQSTESICGQERMQPEKWKTLSIDEKRQALGDCGKELGKAYDSPEPPLYTKKIENTNLQGQYGDGYKYDASRDKYDGQIDVNCSDFKGHGIVGTDYGIRMNQDGMDPNTHKKLFGDDPREAVETYGHEFRHSYQHEQVQRYENGFKVDNSDKAKEWSENFKDYKQPPDAELAKTDREKYFKEYDNYRNQPLEKDANDFGSKLSARIYGDKERIEGSDK